MTKQEYTVSSFDPVEERKEREKIPLTPSLISHEWTAPASFAGQKAFFEIYACFIGVFDVNTLERVKNIKVTCWDTTGTEIGCIEDYMLNDHYVGSFDIPADTPAGEQVYFEVELVGNDLKGTSGYAKVYPEPIVENFKWSKDEGELGEVYTLEADVKNVNDGIQAHVLVYEFDRKRQAHDRVGQIPTRVKDEKVLLQWSLPDVKQFEDRLAKREVEELGGEYVPLEYFFTVQIGTTNYNYDNPENILLVNQPERRVKIWVHDTERKRMPKGTPYLLDYKEGKREGSISEDVGLIIEEEITAEIGTLYWGDPQKEEVKEPVEIDGKKFAYVQTLSFKITEKATPDTDEFYAERRREQALLGLRNLGYPDEWSEEDRVYLFQLDYWQTFKELCDANFSFRTNGELNDGTINAILKIQEDGTEVLEPEEDEQDEDDDEYREEEYEDDAGAPISKKLSEVADGDGFVFLRFLTRNYYPLIGVECSLFNDDDKCVYSGETDSEGIVFWGDLPIDGYYVRLELEDNVLDIVCPWQADDEEHHDVVALEAEKLLDTKSQKANQIRLKGLGYDCGPVDGLVGPKTRKQVHSFQWDVGIVADRDPGPVTTAYLKRRFGA